MLFAPYKEENGPGLGDDFFGMGESDYGRTSIYQADLFLRMRMEDAIGIGR